jgi:hypothetical protein
MIVIAVEKKFGCTLRAGELRGSEGAREGERERERERASERERERASERESEREAYLLPDGISCGISGLHVG